MKKVVTVTGIRPDFIRMSEVFRRLDEKFEHVLVHTGQHYDPNLSDVFFQDLSIRAPDYNLSIGGPGKPHYTQVADLSVKLTELCIEIQPDLVIFLGDSNSVLAAIPLHKEGFKVAHIEAGMRSYDRRMLEETNRVACDHVSDMLFVYHENYAEKARREGIPDDRICVVGNTIVEPTLKIADSSYSAPPKHIALDIHRPENFKSKLRMQRIVDAAKIFSKTYNLPVKMLEFGRTKKYLVEYGIELSGIDLVPLMGYRDFLRFQQESFFVFSDSGSAQEEAPLLNKLVVVPRDFTERPESIVAQCSAMLSLEGSEQTFLWTVSRMVGWINTNEGNILDVSWLGAGTTSELIVDKISCMLER